MDQTDCLQVIWLVTNEGIWDQDRLANGNPNRYMGPDGPPPGDMAGNPIEGIWDRDRRRYGLLRYMGPDDRLQVIWLAILTMGPPPGDMDGDGMPPHLGMKDQIHYLEMLDQQVDLLQETCLRVIQWVNQVNGWWTGGPLPGDMPPMDDMGKCNTYGRCSCTVPRPWARNTRPYGWRHGWRWYDASTTY